MVLLLFLGIKVQAQQWTISDSLSLNAAVRSVSSDVLGNLYVANHKGELSRYSASLEKQETYSNQQLETISALDAGQMLRIFAFYEETQQFQFFNRFLNPLHPPKGFSHKSGTAQIGTATMSSDQMIWLVDEANLRLQKYNPILEQVILSMDLSYYVTGVLEAKSLKERNNQLFLHQQDEILVFDFMGNFISKLPLQISGPFSIYENRLYYCQDNQVFVYRLDNMQTTSVHTLREEDVEFVIGTKDKLYLFSKKKIRALRKIN